jgi:hypothetical protein
VRKVYAPRHIVSIQHGIVLSFRIGPIEIGANGITWQTAGDDPNPLIRNLYIHGIHGEMQWLDYSNG